MLNFLRLPICGHDWHVIEATHHSTLSGYQDAITPSTKPNEANAVSRRERDDAGMSGYVQGRDLRPAPRLAPGLDVERDRSCCAGVNRAWCLGEHTLHRRSVKLPGPFGQRDLPERWAKELVRTPPAALRRGRRELLGRRTCTHLPVVGVEERYRFGRLPRALEWIERNLDASSG